MQSASRITRVLLVGGVVTLGLNAAGAGWLWHHGAALRAAPDGPPSAGANETEGVVCLGFVDLERQVVSLAPLQPGRVAEVTAREGEPVEAGTVLLKLDDAAARLKVEEAQVALEAARARRDEAKSLPERHQARLRQQTAAVEAAGHRLDAARLTLARQEQLVKVNQTSAHEAGAAEKQVRELEAAERAEAAKLSELRSHDPAAEVRRAELEVAAAQNRLGQARQALEEYVVRAPEAGAVLRIQVGPGDVLPAAAKQPALLFAPDGPRVVRAEVDQEFAGRVAAGQAARVEDDAPSGKAWRGRVLRVADWFHPGRNIVNEPSRSPTARTVECLVELESGQPAPRLGQRVRVFLGAKE